jgi:hypothetical protein
VPRLDAYTATVRDVDPAAIMTLVYRHRAHGDSSRERDGFFGFGQRLCFRDESGSEYAAVQWGGKHGDLGMLEVKGDRTPEVVQDVRETFKGHNCTRIDSCEDRDAPGVFDEMLREVMAVKKRHGLRGERRGDWDFPEDGRTQYLGAPTSAVRVRLYEKGKQPDMRHLCRFDLVRIEAQVRPVNEARQAFAQVDALQVWGASPFTRELAGRVLHTEVGRIAAGTVYRESERDRALRWMCEQYGAHLISLKDDLGDWQSVGLTLNEMIGEGRDSRAKRKRHARGG